MPGPERKTANHQPRGESYEAEVNQGMVWDEMRPTVLPGANTVGLPLYSHVGIQPTWVRNILGKTAFVLNNFSFSIIP